MNPNEMRAGESLADDAKDLLEATAESTDKKVTEARKRLTDAIEKARQFYAGVQESVIDGAKAADECAREHPYQSMAVAFGVGALVGILLGRRTN